MKYAIAAVATEKLIMDLYKYGVVLPGTIEFKIAVIGLPVLFLGIFVLGTRVAFTSLKNMTK